MLPHLGPVAASGNVTPGDIDKTGRTDGKDVRQLLAPA